MGSALNQLGVYSGPRWATWSQFGSLWRQLSPAWADMIQCGPIWGQLETNTILKITELLMVFLRFFIILRKSLKAFGNAFGNPLGRLGEPLGSPGEALETLWEALRTPWEALGTPWERLGRPPWQNLGGTTWKDLPESTSVRRPLAQLPYR